MIDLNDRTEGDMLAYENRQMEESKKRFKEKQVKRAMELIDTFEKAIVLGGVSSNPGNFNVKIAAKESAKLHVSMQLIILNVLKNTNRGDEDTNLAAIIADIEILQKTLEEIVLPGI